MVLLLGGRGYNEMPLRQALAERGVLSVAAVPSFLNDAINAYRFTGVVYTEPEKRASMKEAGSYLSVQYPFLTQIALCREGAAKNIFQDASFLDAAFSADADISAVRRFLMESAMKKTYIDFSTLISGFLRIDLYKETVYYHMHPFKLNLPTLLLLRALTFCYDRPLSGAELMKLAFEPLGIGDRTAVSRTVRSLNLRVQKKGYQPLVACRRGQGYFLCAE